MDNLESRTAAPTDFWKGIMLGTMAGMFIAAWTYGIADRIPLDTKKSKQDSQRTGPKLVQNTAA
jgi:hypothetical protein